MSHRFQTIFLLLLVAIVGGMLPEVGYAQRSDFETKDVKGVGITERLGATLPEGLVFRNHVGEDVSLQSLLDGERPTILTFNYASCPQLCVLQLDGFISTLNKLDSWEVGNQFQILTISLDPNETDEMAQKFRDRVLAGYSIGSAEDSWHFLRGDEASIRAAADAAGFRYNYISDVDEYAHAAAVILLDPKGQIARYLYGIEYPPSTLRLSLAETADSKFVSTVDALILRCFVYDASSGTFVADAWNITRVILGVFALLLIMFLVWLHFLDRKPTHPSVA